MSEEDWRSKAHCLGKETNWFYPETGVKGYAKQIADVKAFCRLCKVSAQCLDNAILNKESFGIWGGLTPKERSNLVKNRTTTAKKVLIKAVKVNDSNKV
jgi:WhiB family redox-sensing transcriptional regulator